MSIIDCWLFSIALAADCFSIGVTCGMIEKRFHIKQVLLMAVLFGIFQAGMPVVGWSVFSIFGKYIETFDHWIAFLLLLFIGVRMIRESLCCKCNTIFDPCKIGTLLYLAVATSIDALAVGIVFNSIGLRKLGDITIPVVIIGMGSFFLTLIGKGIGVVIGQRFNINAELVGGIILILLGLKIVLNG